MQNPETGRMEPMTEAQVAAAGGSATVRREAPARVFFVGQEVEVNGGRFVVRKITNKDVVLRGVPTRG